MENQEKTEKYNNEEIDFYDEPLSPVLFSNKVSREYSLRKNVQKKSRVNLEDRFSTEDMQNENKSKKEQLDTLIDETLTPSQKQNVLESIEVFEKIEEEQHKTHKVLPHQQINEDFDFKKPVSPSPHVKKMKTGNRPKSFEYQGFQTATGKNIHLSNAMIEKSKSLFNDILNPLNVNLDKSRSNKYSFLSKTKSKTCNSERFKTKENVNIEGITVIKSDSVASHSDFNKQKVASISSSGGFVKASGGRIQISESALKAAKTIFAQEFDGDSKFSSNAFSGINLESTDKEMGVLCSQETDTLFANFTVIEDKLCKKVLDQIDNISKNNATDEGFKGFNENVVNDSHRKVKEIKKIVNREISIFQCYKRPPQEFYNLPNQKRFKSQHAPTNTVPCGNFKGFASASGNAIKISKTSLKRAEEIFKEIDVNTISNSLGDFNNSSTSNSSHKIISTVSDESSQPKMGFQTALGNSFKLSEDALNKAKQLFQNISNDFPLDGNSSSSKNIVKENTSLDKGPYTSERSVSTISSAKKSNRKKRLGVSLCRPIDISNHKIEKAKLLFENEKSLDYSPIKVNQTSVYNSTPLKHAISNIDLDPDITPIKCVNDSAILNHTSGYTEIVADGRIVMQDCTKGNIDTWSENLELERKKLEAQLKIIKERQEALNFQKCLFRRNCQDHQRQGVSSINTLDGACVIPNTKDLIGVPEIEMAFKVMPGVEPKLIPTGWIRNHFKWIVWKLASYERFTTNLKGCLTVENVIQQLKYRYDREIDRAERPTLRKIFEKDDVPQKRMVLCVSDIFNVYFLKINSKFELELTDGWYSIRTIIDEPLCSQVLKNTIAIGTKLVMCGAELLNCDGCHPLEATDMVRLKIGCNSTRRAVWYAKLGYQKCVEPFPLKLQSLFPAGGSVGCIKIYIARVYPIKYMEKKNKLTESLQEVLSPSQKNDIRNYQERLSCIQQQELNIRIQDNITKLQFTQRDVTPVQQLLVIDVLDAQEKACIFQIWKPSETHLELLKETAVFYVYNVLPK
ncbi:breast cancer type 2 susceptibility protein -like [Asbolus verrucosus]|uniref:Breast cancer type 2 susceptibility protein-like n=1 Tax=Asbolus verrucosus TaxID=1661398 RepID=A0A482VXK3_ASBVE|nr:breast cancer type 2 susceptibility protein -like [Asbolus verrucosus]